MVESWVWLVIAGTILIGISLFLKTSVFKPKKLGLYSVYQQQKPLEERTLESLTMFKDNRGCVPIILYYVSFDGEVKYEKKAFERKMKVPDFVKKILSSKPAQRGDHLYINATQKLIQPEDYKNQELSELYQSNIDHDGFFYLYLAQPAEASKK